MILRDFLQGLAIVHAHLLNLAESLSLGQVCLSMRMLAVRGVSQGLGQVADLLPS